MKSNEFPNLDLNKLRTFFAIAQSGGVSAAAERLALTRSAVSHSLAGLEASLEFALFHRVGKRLVLTREGALLRDAFADVERRITGVLDEIRDDAPELTGSIRLGLFVGFSRFALTSVLRTFLAEHPRVRVRVVYGSRADAVEGLLEGRLDFALALRGPKTPSAIRSTRLFDQHLVLACRERPRGGSGFRALSRLTFVDFFRSEPLIDRWVAHHFGRRQHIDRARIRVWAGPNSDLALELARAGVAATVLPAGLVEPYRERGELVVVRGLRPPLRDGIWLDELARARLTRIRQAFRAALFDHAR